MNRALVVAIIFGSIALTVALRWRLYWVSESLTGWNVLANGEEAFLQIGMIRHGYTASVVETAFGAVRQEILGTRTIVVHYDRNSVIRAEHFGGYGEPFPYRGHIYIRANSDHRKSQYLRWGTSGFVDIENDGVDLTGVRDLRELARNEGWQLLSHFDPSPSQGAPFAVGERQFRVSSTADAKAEAVEVKDSDGRSERVATTQVGFRRVSEKDYRQWIDGSDLLRKRACASPGAECS